jgi:hypothetical protein
MVGYRYGGRDEPTSHQSQGRMGEAERQVSLVPQGRAQGTIDFLL